MSNVDTRPVPPPAWDELGAALMETIRAHNAKIEDDLTQMRSLVEDAISKLVAAYHLLQAQAKIGFEYMQEMKRESDPDAADEETCATQSVGTSAALTALQFEDVLMQLLHRLSDRCERFRPLPTTLVEGVLSTVQEECHDRHTEAQLEAFRKQLATLQCDLESAGERDIGQSSMDHGSVELF